MELSHANLCQLAVGWLKRPNSRGGHGCHVALAECKTGWCGEMPDAIGFRASGGWDDGTVMVEVKVSRSDFLADKAKPHRIAGGVGDWRYFMAPEGLIKLDELPEKWGLIEANKRGHIKTVKGVYQDASYYDAIERSKSMRHEDANRLGELFIAVRLLARIENAGGLHEIIKENFRLTEKNRKPEEVVRQLERQARLRAVNQGDKQQ